MKKLYEHFFSSQEVVKAMFKNLYEVAYTRGSSWLVGVFIGYLIATKQFNFNKVDSI